MNRPFVFSHAVRTPQDYFWERFFGILPGFLSWAILIGITLFSFTRPLYAAVVIIAIDIFWLFRIFYMTLFLVLAYAVLAIEKETDWIERCRLLEKGQRALSILRKKRWLVGKRGKIKRWFDFKNQERELREALRRKIRVPSFDSIYHVVLIAAAREGAEVIEPGLEALSCSRFPAQRILPVLAIEERAGAQQLEMAEGLCRKYRRHFFDFLVAVHPDGIPGEARVKGANATCAAKQTARFLEEKKIPFEHVVLSCFDADTIPSANYFAALTYHFMRHPNRTRSSFQPIPVYHNNILEAPAFVRVLETGSSFFQLVEATNPEKLVTFSSHSMSFKALVEIGYWPVDMISDDSAIFWKALIHYGGDYRVVPMYVTLSMDVVTADSVAKTLVSVYRQKKRWAWGVENFPIVMRAFIQEKRISFASKLRYVIKLLEMHISWATLGFLMTLIGWLPAIFAGQEFSNSVVYYNSSRITGLIFNLASTALVITIILSHLLLPKRKTHYPFSKRILLALEWLLVPLVFTFLSCLPALDAQTCLMAGRALEFRISEKKRKKMAPKP